MSKRHKGSSKARRPSPNPVKQATAVSSPPPSAHASELAALTSPAVIASAPEPYLIARSQPSVPRLSPGQERIVRAFALLGVLVGGWWIVWRWTQTLNPDALAFSLLLVVAETVGYLSTVMFVFTVWKLEHREAPPPPANARVDVFITVYDEPLEIVRRTAVGAREIRYPHRTYILDDGKRDEVEALAAEVGVGYIRREGNEHAKAGNLNHAFTVTDGEFVLQLDADHVPLPHILDRLLGFFEDPKVAFVQSPQDFYNTDSFTHAVNDRTRVLWDEQRIFFSLIQAGKDHWNAAFFCGSCGVLRRAAFDEIGGFSTETITEDMETSMLLHARGWRSVYYGESLAYGLAPASAAAFHVQRLRWGQGSMQILRKFKPMRHPGLSFAQRICYFSSVTSYFEGAYKLVLYLAPLLFLLTGAMPIRVEERSFLLHFVPYLLVSLLMFKLLARGTGFLMLAERYSMAKFFTYLLAISGFFANRPLRFKVTPKGATDVPFSTYAPQLVLAVISLTAIVWSFFALRFAWVDYGVPGWGSLAIWFNVLWALWNLYAASFVVYFSLYMKQQRHDHRFSERIPLQVRASFEDERAPVVMAALTEDLNPRGFAFRAPMQLDEGARVTATLQLSTGTVPVTGKVVHTGTVKSPAGVMYRHGVEFDELPVADRDAIELHCTHHAVPAARLMYHDIGNTFGAMLRWFYDPRLQRRREVHLPARVWLDSAEDDERFGTIEELSGQGLRLLLAEPVAPGTRVRYEIPGMRLEGSGEARFVRALETPLGVRFAIGVRTA